MSKKTKTKKVKKIKVVKPAVTMISYSIKMTIPTAQYANIQPEIVVNAGTPEEAEAYIIPHMNKLWKEYFMIGERRAEPAKTVAPVAPVLPVQKKEETQQEVKATPVAETPMAPAAAVAFTKASQAVASCLSQEALDIITGQVKKSVKLDDKEKDKLMVLIINKQKEFNGGGKK